MNPIAILPNGTSTRKKLNCLDHHNRRHHRNQRQNLQNTSPNIAPTISPMHHPTTLRSNKPFTCTICLTHIQRVILIAYHRNFFLWVLFCLMHLQRVIVITYHRLILLLVLFCIMYIPRGILVAYHWLYPLLVWCRGWHPRYDICGIRQKFTAIFTTLQRQTWLDQDSFSTIWMFSSHRTFPAQHPQQSHYPRQFVPSIVTRVICVFIFPWFCFTF